MDLSTLFLYRIEASRAGKADMKGGGNVRSQREQRRKRHRVKEKVRKIQKDTNLVRYMQSYNRVFRTAKENMPVCI